MKQTEEKTAMDFWGRVENIQAQKKINLKVICEKHGIPYQTTLNQKSSAHLPSLVNACLIASELGCSVEWLLFGDETTVKLTDCNQLAQNIFRDKRLFAITDRLSSLTQEELYALEVLLKIRG